MTTNFLAKIELFFHLHGSYPGKNQKNPKEAECYTKNYSPVFTRYFQSLILKAIIMMVSDESPFKRRLELATGLEPVTC